jgi:hypothetical protein
LRPFDLAHGPLLRTRLLKAADCDHTLLFTMHHIISDGWSMGVVVRELGALYNAYAAGQRPSLPELAIQYADYASWQRRWLSGPPLERELEYWRTQLRAAPPVVLPLDRPRSRAHTTRGKQRKFRLDTELSAKLEGLSRERGATLFMTLLASFQLLLHSYSGQQDICVATTIAGRTRAELEPLVGFFLNRLVLRTRITSVDTYTSLLDQVRETTLGAYAHQDAPFDRVIEALGLTDDASQNPLCQAVFVLQNMPMPALRLDQLSVEFLAVEVGSSKFDLALVMTEEPDGLDGFFEYKADLFDDSTIAAMVLRFDALLRTLVDEPQQPLARHAPQPPAAAARDRPVQLDPDHASNERVPRARS